MLQSYGGRWNSNVFMFIFSTGTQFGTDNETQFLSNKSCKNLHNSVYKGCSNGCVKCEAYRSENLKCLVVNIFPSLMVTSCKCPKHKLFPDIHDSSLKYLLFVAKVGNILKYFIFELRCQNECVLVIVLLKSILVHVYK